MKKKALVVALVSAALLTFTGCALFEKQGPDGAYEATEEEKIAAGIVEDPNSSQDADGQKKANAEIGDTSEEKAGEGSTDEENVTEGDADVNKFVTACDFEAVENFDEASQHAHITAHNSNGDILWEYDTEETYITELDCLQEIGITTSGYIFIVGGKVYCVDVTDGDKCSFAWKNDSDVGASCCYTMGNDGNLYLCGYYGPDLTVIDAGGNTVNQFGHFEYPEEMDGEDYFWPTEIKIDENNPDIGYIKYEGGGDSQTGEAILQVDLSAGKVIGKSE